MNLLHETRSRFSWFLSLGQTIHRITASQILAAVATFIFGQICLVLAMLLPLKAILLAATDGVPWYLSGFVSADTKDAFIITLAFGALLAYGLNLSSERIIAGRLDSGVSCILEHSRKLTLFRNERGLVRSHYYRFCRIIANAVLFAIAAVLGLAVDLPLFIALLALFLAQYLIAARILHHQTALGQTLRHAFVEDRGRLLSIVTNINFLIGFAFLFAQFLASTERNAILAIIVFLLLRQTTNRLRLAVLDFIALSDDRHRINPLFHTNFRYVPPPDTRQEAFFLAMQPDQRRLWIPEALAGHAGPSSPELVESHWNDTGNLGIAALDVRMRTTDGSGSQPDNDRFDYFLRCFAAAHIHEAEHEAQLFESSTPSIAPDYLGRTNVADFVVLIFRSLPKAAPSRSGFARALPELLRQCEQTPLDASVQDNYERTHRNLAQRLEESLIARLRAAADSPSSEAIVRTLEDQLPHIIAQIQSLPAVLVNPDLVPNYCRVSEDGRIVAWSWHRWRIDLLNARSLRDQTGKPLHSIPPGKISADNLSEQDRRRVLASSLEELETTLRRGLLTLGLRQAANLLQLWEQIQREARTD